MYLLQDSLMNMKSSKNSIYLNLLSKIMSVIFLSVLFSLAEQKYYKKKQVLL